MHPIRELLTEKMPAHRDGPENAKEAGRIAWEIWSSLPQENRPTSGQVMR